MYFERRKKNRITKYGLNLSPIIHYGLKLNLSPNLNPNLNPNPNPIGSDQNSQ